MSKRENLLIAEYYIQKDKKGNVGYKYNISPSYLTLAKEYYFSLYLLPAILCSENPRNIPLFNSTLRIKDQLIYILKLDHQISLDVGNFYLNIKSCDKIGV